MINKAYVGKTLRQLMLHLRRPIGFTALLMRTAYTAASNQFGAKMTVYAIRARTAVNKQKMVFALDSLGFSNRHLDIYRRKIKSPDGLILHVGPTGSGKTTTLYAALQEIQKPEINIQTIEDPIEYTIPGINQLQVHSAIGLTFARALRGFLRQDPNVILVGEIRDSETAEIATAAAITGHLVFSTLHTTDAATTIIRLTEMKVEPYMLSASLVLVCAQRLVRRLCPLCKQAYQPSMEDRNLMGDAAEEITIYKATGCNECFGTGYKSRIGIHEILVPNEVIRRQIRQKEIAAEELKEIAVNACGMTSLYWDAIDKVRQGICSLEEIWAKIRKNEEI